MSGIADPSVVGAVANTGAAINREYTRSSIFPGSDPEAQRGEWDTATLLEAMTIRQSGISSLGV